MTRIIIDLSNLAYVCFHASRRRTREGYDKRLYLSICNNKIDAIRKATRATSIWFAKDNYPDRKDLDTDYKSNRKKLEYPIKQDLIEELIRRYNAKIFEAKKKEADDVMATLLHKGKVDCIVSTDQDLLQAIMDGGQLFNPVTMQYWTKDKLMQKYKLKRFKDILFHKAFLGDSSDAIPRAGMYIPRKELAEIINKRKFRNWGDLKKIVARTDWNYRVDFKRVKLNYKLVKLDTNCKVRRVR